MKKANEQSLGDIIKSVISELRWSDKINENKIMASWEKIMGPQIFQYTEKIVYEKNILIVTLKSAPLRNELNYAKTKIIKNINEEFDENIIRDIIFK
ncbi:MAG: DUF721 domain-containing protein [Bacteroidota bacterium]